MLEHFDTVLSFTVVMLLLSLLVTTLVQMVLAAIGLRGRVLKWGIAKLLQQVSPDLSGDDAGKIAQAVLTHPMIQHLGNRRATSIRKEELIRLLDDLARERIASKPSAEKESATQAHANRDRGTDDKNATDPLTNVLGVVRTPDFEDSVTKLKAALEQAFPQNAAQVRQVVDRTLGDTRKVVTDIDLWFDTVMDRTTENFLVKTRWVTAGVSLLLAGFLHVDSLGIIRQLASQPEVRAKLLQSADATLLKAENTLALTSGQKPIASAAIEDLKAQFATSPSLKALTNIPVNLVTREEGRGWLNA